MFTRLQRLNASGLVKWNAGVVSRILNNQTYMGVMAYGKSYSNNYLEQKRVNNHDASTYMCVKADFEPIVSEEEWYKCQEIKARRVRTSFKSANEATQKKKSTHGIKENKDLWGSKLLCTCGHSFRKNRWHKNKGMLATEDAIQNPDICWDEIQSSLNAMIDFSNPQIDRHIIRKFVSKIVPNGRNHFRWYMNLDGKDTTTIDMVTEGRKSNAVISFNDDEEDEPPLHIGDVIGLTELQQFFPNLLKNENQNGIISNVAKYGKKSSLDAILHRQRLLMAGNKLYSIR